MQRPRQLNSKEEKRAQQNIDSASLFWAIERRVGRKTSSGLSRIDARAKAIRRSDRVPGQAGRRRVEWERQQRNLFAQQNVLLRPLRSHQVRRGWRERESAAGVSGAEDKHSGLEEEKASVFEFISCRKPRTRLLAQWIRWCVLVNTPSARLATSNASKCKRVNPIRTYYVFKFREVTNIFLPRSS